MNRFTRHAWMYSTAVIIIVSLFVLAGCGEKEQTTGSASQTGTIKIALVGPITGGDAEFGQDAANGGRLAVEEANAKGGVLGRKIELVVMDDKGDPKEGVSAANKICADPSIVAVAGHINSGTTIPASAVYNRSGIPVVSPSSTNPRITQQGFNNVFRVCITDSVQGPFAAQLAMDKLGKKSFAVLHDKSAYGQGVAESFKDELEKKSAKVLLFEGITKGDTDFSALLTRVRGLKPDVIFFGGMSPEGGLIARQANQLGVGATMMTPDGCFAPQFIKISGDGAEGVILTFLAPPWDKEPTAAEFVKKYTEKYGDIKNYAPFGYDATWTIIKAIEKAGKTDRAAITTALHDPGFSYKGITGEIRFDKNGDVIGRSPYVYIVHNGKFEVYK